MLNNALSGAVNRVIWCADWRTKRNWRWSAHERQDPPLVPNNDKSSGFVWVCKQRANDRTSSFAIGPSTEQLEVKRSWHALSIKRFAGKGKGKESLLFSNQRTFDPSTHCRVVDIISPDFIVSNEFANHLWKILPDALTQIYNDFVNPDDEWDAEDGYEVNDGLDYEATTAEHVRDESDGSKASAAQIAPKWDFSSGIN